LVKYVILKIKNSQNLFRIKKITPFGVIFTNYSF
jgi:hypothetical protein